MSCEQILFPDSKFDNKKDNFLEDNFLKMGHSRPLFHLFSSFLNYNETFINVTDFLLSQTVMIKLVLAQAAQLGIIFFNRKNSNAAPPGGTSVRTHY